MLCQWVIALAHDSLYACEGGTQDALDYFWILSFVDDEAQPQG